MSSRTFYVGPFIHCLTLTTLEIVEHGTICVDDSSGVILSVQRVGVDYTSSDASILTPHSLVHDKLQHPTTTAGEERGSTRIQVAPKDHFFFPGLIDTHVHASQYPNIGVFGESTLLDWLNKYTWPLEASLSSPALAARVYTRCVSRSLSAGTTTAAYYATQDASSTNVLASTVHAKGQRGFIGRCGMDSELSPTWYRDASPEACVSASRACWEFCKTLDPTGRRVQSIVTPRFAPSCSREALEGLGALLAEGAHAGLRCQTHISENAAEIALVRELFPEFDSYAGVYDGFGLLTDRTVLAHAVHLSEREIALVRSRGAGVAHCPTSNLALGSGDAKVRKLLDAGIPVGLGTDVSGGYDVNVLAAARAACLVSRSVAITQGDTAKLAVEEALYLATRGGAKVLGLEKLVGAFEVGMQWDACLVGLDAVPEDGELDGSDIGGVDLFGWEPWPDKIAKWLYGGDERNIRKVWVGGELVHEKAARKS